MKSNLLCLLAAVCCALCADSAFAGELFVGASRVELQLPPRVPLAGYSKRRGRPSTGQHDPLYVRAVVLQEAGQQSVALVSCELLIIDDSLRREVRRRVQQAGLPFAEHAVMITATHTHSGPGAYGRRYLEKLSMGHYDPRVFETVVAAIMSAIQEAQGRRVAAGWELAATEVPGFNRNRIHEGGPVDREVIIVRFRTPDGAPLASLVTASAHPTVLNWRNRALSGDYPGDLMRAVEERQPGSVCLFVPGAIADQGPVTDDAQDPFERSRRLGLRLADAVLAAAPRAAGHHRSDGAPWTRLGACGEEMPLPPARLRLGRVVLPAWLGKSFLDRTASLNVIALDSLRFIGVPGDLSSEIGQQWKAQARGRRTEPVILGFADDYIGYMLPEAEYRTTEYEARMMFNGPRVAEQLTQAVQACLQRLANALSVE